MRQNLPVVDIVRNATFERGDHRSRGPGHALPQFTSLGSGQRLLLEGIPAPPILVETRCGSTLRVFTYSKAGAGRCKWLASTPGRARLCHRLCRVAQALQARRHGQVRPRQAASVDGGAPGGRGMACHSHRPRAPQPQQPDHGLAQVVPVRELPKEQRMREIERYMKALDLNIHDWVSTMTIGKKGR
jgi:hypothetical protein